jgi:hypothetical protein
LPRPAGFDSQVTPSHMNRLANMLINELIEAGFQPEDLAHDPFGALEGRTDIQVQLLPTLGSGCSLTARYDDTTDPPSIFVRASRSRGRENFSVLHELAHHAQASCEPWIREYYEVANRSDRQRLKEQTANTVAARLLLPDEFIESCLGPRREASAIAARKMFEGSAASMTACLVRLLDLPGERIVMLGTPNGALYFAADTGHGFRHPSIREPQPTLIAAYDRAVLDPEEAAVIRGGHGVCYSSTPANTNVVFDVALCEGILLAVVTRGQDQRHSFGDQEMVTGSICGHDFETQASSGRCAECGELRCAECRLCACEHKKPKVCTQCRQPLYAADLAAKRSEHDECW